MNAHRWTSRVATCWSVVLMGLGLWWTLRPSAHLLGRAASEDNPPLTGLDGPWLVAVGVLGTAVALALRDHRHPAVPRRPLLLAAAGMAAFCLVVPGHMPLLAVAYTMAFAGPLVLIAALLSRALGLGTRGTSIMVGTPAVAGLLFFTVIVVTSGAHWALFVVAGFGVWTALTVTGHRVHKGRCDGCGRPGASWTRPESAARWGRKVTLAAAIMPLPYGLARLTWFTPWPIAFPDDAGWGIWVTGILLGFASEGGAILTHGLIRPWGEVWPRWVPVLHGRPIPVAGPTLAAFTAATMLALLMVFISVSAITEGADLLFVVAFVPLGLWSPLLAAAAVAYYYRRRGTCATCHAGPVTTPAPTPHPVPAT